MKKVDNVGITFVNGVVGRGVLNGVVNLQLGAYTFDAEDDGKTINTDLSIVCRLRMDKMCAQGLYETLGDLLQAIQTQEAALVQASEPEATPAERKPN